MTRRSSPAAVRNREPIRDVLLRHLPAAGQVLEIAAGTGEHAVFLASAFPALQWQPTDPDADARASIAAWREAEGPDNLLPPLALDAAAPETWPEGPFDAIVCINMIHISPWAATEGLMAGAGRALSPGGLLYLYGPYREDEVETAASNLAFDESLRSRNPAWGLRRREAVEALAADCGLTPVERVAMPANNLSLIFRKADQAARQTT